MKVRYVTSSCVGVEHAGKKVLCDPWLTDGIYYGSWYHYPPLQFRPEDFADADFLYLSHIHPDHFDEETLKRFPKTVPVLILDYAEKFLLRRLERLGFRRIQEVPHGGEVQLGDDFTVELLAADGCDPALCGKFFGCAPPTPYARTLQLDSMAVFRGGGQTAVDINDCPYELARSACASIRARHPQVDFALLGYSGAGEYPQCFADQMDGTALREAAQAKREQFLTQTIRFLQELRPIRFMPCGGQYTLGGDLAKLNGLRGIPELEELPEEFARRLQCEGLTSQLVLLNSGEWFDLERAQASAPFVPPDPLARQRYIEETLSKKRFQYQENGGQASLAPGEDLTARLQRAQSRMWRRQQEHGYRSDWRLYLDAGQEELYCVPFNGEAVEKTPRGKEAQPFVRIRLDPALLNMILNRQAHWNNAAIGSHLKFYRRPDQFERGIYHWLSYLHC